VGVEAPSYKGFRFPAEIISHCVWLYHRFPLSFREVEEMMLARGVVVSHETVRQWCAKFGQTYANALRRRRPRPGDTWHLDEVFITINGRRQYLWRAVDQNGNVLDILVTSRRDTRAATRFFSQAAEGPGVRAPGAGHGQTRQLRRGPAPGAALGRAPSVEVSEQPGREFASTDPGAGTSDEEVHLSPACPAVLIRLQRHLPARPARPSPALRPGVPPRDDRPIHHLEPDHRHGHGGLTRVVGTGPTNHTMLITPDRPNKLTMPSQPPGRRPS
jgi:putative transposase